MEEERQKKNRWQQQATVARQESTSDKVVSYCLNCLCRMRTEYIRAPWKRIGNEWDGGAKENEIQCELRYSNANIYRVHWFRSGFSEFESEHNFASQCNEENWEKSINFHFILCVQFNLMCWRWMGEAAGGEGETGHTFLWTLIPVITGEEWRWCSHISIHFELIPQLYLHFVMVLTLPSRPKHFWRFHRTNQTKWAIVVNR